MNLAEFIVAQATKDTEFTPFPDNTRQRIKTGIILTDVIPKRYRTTKVYDLHFWNDISGFFHSNVPIHKVYDTTNGEIEIPEDIETINRSFDSSFMLVVAGDYFVTKDYEVYRCYGWDNCDGSAEIYFDFV